LGFLRLSTSPRLFPQPLGMEKAPRYIEIDIAHRLVRKVLPGEGSWALLRHLLALCGTVGNLVHDADPTAFALEYNARIATRDTDFTRFPGIKTLKPSENGEGTSEPVYARQVTARSSSG